MNFTANVSAGQDEGNTVSISRRIKYSKQPREKKTSNLNNHDK